MASKVENKAENRIKLMLVGEENVGKTSLLRALKSHLSGATRKRKQTITTLGRATALLNFGTTSKKQLHAEDESQVSGDTLSTDGIDLLVEPLPISEAALAMSSSKDKARSKTPMAFSVWDFGGQEVYHTTHSFFLTERSIYLVIYRADRDEKDSRVSYWLNTIKSHAPNAPIIIVATHLDKYMDTKSGKKMKPREVEEALSGPIMEKYKSKFLKLDKTVRPVSTLNLKGIDELIRQIHEVAMKQPYAQESPPPERWFNLESIFFDKRRRDNAEGLVPVLSWEDVINVSRIALFPQNDNQGELIKAIDYLHDTGSVYKHLYTDELTGQVHRQIIVDPQWIARVFATVLTTKHGYLKSGVMDEQKLYEQLWREYPKTTHTLLMDLFQQFDLLYKVQDDKGKPTGEILIPSALPVQKPSDVQPLLPGKETSLYQFERRYGFEFVPAGLFSRYLVRTMHLAEPIRYWRYGCLLQDKKIKATALIELKPQSNVLTIIVRAENEPTQFFCKLVELFEFLVEHFFRVVGHPQYLDPITGAQFTLEQIEAASVQGQTSVTSKDGTQISIDRVAPDLALTTFQSLQIDVEKEIVLGEVLGEGAFASVHAGTYQNEPVAVKRLLRCSTKEQQKRLFSEFRREVMTMTSFNHPNIVNLRGFSNQPPFSMIMELVPHGTLYDFIRKPDPISWPMRIRIAYDIACAMAFLHSTDPPLIHKDLKSPNILMAGTTHDAVIVAKVADFGISGKLYSSKFKAISAREREVENPTWLAPEVIREEPSTAFADVYPFGIMLWELAARAHPFDEFHTEFPTDLEQLIVDGKRPTIPKDCPPAFEALIQDCWNGNPSARPTFAKIVSRFATIIAEVAPSLPPVISRVRRDQAEFVRQQEALKKSRYIERQERWKKMREEEIIREKERDAERRRSAAAAAAAFPGIDDDLASLSDSGDSSKLSSSAAGSTISAPDSLKQRTKTVSEDSAKDDMSFESKPRSLDDMSANGSIRGAGHLGRRGVELGNVYQRLGEMELKDLWIQRGIPLQETIVSKARLASVLDQDDQWLFNQRKLLLATSSASKNGLSSISSGNLGAGAKSGSAQATIRSSIINNSGSVPFSISIPSLHVDSPLATSAEIKERNDLLVKQEKALVDLLKAQELARMELHMKHTKAFEGRKPPTAPSPPPKEVVSSLPSSPANDTSKPVVSSIKSNFLSSSARPTGNTSTHHATLQKSTSVNSGTPSNIHLQRPVSPLAPTQVPTSNSPTPKAPPAPPKPVVPARSVSTSEGKPLGQATQASRIIPPRPVSVMASIGSAPQLASSSTDTTGATTATSSAMAATSNATTATATSDGTSSTVVSIPSPSTTPGALVINGAWNVSKRTAGGSPNTPFWRRNPQYCLTVGPGSVTLSLTMTQSTKEPAAFIAFYIFKTTDKKRVLDLKEKVYSPEHFLNKGSIEAKCSFPEGHFSIMCASFQPEDRAFGLSVVGKGAISLEPVEEWKQCDVTGAWARPYSGGCMNHPTWRNNPKFSLKVNSNDTRLVATLTAQNEVGCGYYVFAASNMNLPVAKSGFTAVSVVQEFTLDTGDYVIVPTTYEFGKESHFEITVYSDKKCEMATLPNTSS